MFKKYEWRILVRVALLFITLCITAYLLMKGPGSYVYLALIIPVVIYELVDFYRFHKKLFFDYNEKFTPKRIVLAEG